MVLLLWCTSIIHCTSHVTWCFLRFFLLSNKMKLLLAPFLDSRLVMSQFCTCCSTVKLYSSFLDKTDFGHFPRGNHDFSNLIRGLRFSKNTHLFVCPSSTKFQKPKYEQSTKLEEAGSKHVIHRAGGKDNRWKKSSTDSKSQAINNKQIICFSFQNTKAYTRQTATASNS